MNKSFGRATLIGLALSAALFSISITIAAPAQAAGNVEEVNRARLETVIHNNAGPIVVEFFDSTDPDASGECARQKPIFDAAADKYAGRVTFLRFDISQDRALAYAGRLVVCPTHLFIQKGFPDPTTVPTSVPNRTPFRQWGLRDAAQLDELIREFFGI